MGGVLAAIVFKSGDEELPPNAQDLQNIELLDIDGQMVRVGDIMADKKVIMFVNVATK